MSESGEQAGANVTSSGSGGVDLSLEVVVVPVADADRSKAFYAGLGWRLDADLPFDNGVRIVQFTRLGPDVPSNSAPRSRPRHRVRPTGSISSWPTSTLRAPHSWPAEPT